ncbi:MAG: hypothetical protein IPP79_16065 [Chitinophagaceae bacterium]|nr:hypothetical protein [Chitinophagaceae bacterium]
MKHIIVAILLLTAQLVKAQDCTTRAANRPAESVRFQDEYSRSGEGPKVDISVSKMKPYLTISENWVKKAF